MELLINVGIYAVIVLLIGLIVSFPLMWLWNWLMPVLFGLNSISIGQALGLYVLSGLLFKTPIPSKS